MYARRSNYQTRLRDLKDFFRLHQLPKELQQRMSDYFQTTWSLNHGIETSEILRDFPEELRGDVSLHLHREVLSLPIFETAPQGFLKSLARHIESKFCCPTEYLIHRRDALNYLYLVCNGSMEVLQDNMVVAILGKGDLVGYDVTALATPDHTLYVGLNKTSTGPMGGLVKSRCDLKALTYCDLKCIQISGLLEVLKMYPEFSDTFHREIIHDLSFNLRDEGLADAKGPGSTGGTDNDNDNESTNQYSDHQTGTIRQLPAGYPVASKSLPSACIGQLYTSASAGSAAEDETPNDDEDDGDDEEDEEEDEEDEEEEEEEDEEDDDDDEEEEEEEEEEGGGGGGGGGDEDGDDSNDDDDRNSGKGAGREGSHDAGERHAGLNQDGATNTDSSNRKEDTNEERTEKLVGASPSAKEPVEAVSSSSGSSRKRRGTTCRRFLKRVESIERSSVDRTNTPEDSLSTTSFDCILGEHRRKSLAILRPALVARLNGSNPKPPLSFDLSRNTTALVDRRRRSAGCINRAMLSGQLESPTTKRGGSNHSPLVHIGRAQSWQAKRCSTHSETATNNSGTLGVATQTTADHEKPGIARVRPRQARSRELSLKNIDARVAAISASVREMRQELSSELNHFRASLRLLMQLLGSPPSPVSYRAPLSRQATDSSQRACQSATGSGMLARSRSSASLLLRAGSSTRGRPMPAAMGRQHRPQSQVLVADNASSLSPAGSAAPLILLASWRASQQSAPNERLTEAGGRWTQSAGTKSIKACVDGQPQMSLVGPPTTSATASAIPATSPDPCARPEAKTPFMRQDSHGPSSCTSGKGSYSLLKSQDSTCMGAPASVITRAWLSPNLVSESLDSGRSSSSVDSASSTSGVANQHTTQVLLLSSTAKNCQQIDTVALGKEDSSAKHSSGSIV